MRRNIFIILILFFSIFCFAQHTVDIYEVKASSTLLDNPGATYPHNQRVIRYSPDKAFDGDPLTVWAEGAEDEGINEYIDIQFSWSGSKEILIDRIGIMPGYFDEKYYEKNNRVKKAKIEFRDYSNSGYEYVTITNEFEFRDEMAIQYKNLDKPVEAGAISLTILDVYKGNQWNDTCISEIAFYYKGKKIDLVYNSRIKYLNGRYILPDEFMINHMYVCEKSGEEWSNTSGIITQIAEAMAPGVAEGYWRFDEYNCIIELEIRTVNSDKFYREVYIILSERSERLQE